MKLVLRILISIAAVFLATYLLPGVEVDSVQTGIILAIVLGLLNTVVAPILKLLTLPITCLTFGLFLLVINTLMVLLAEWLVDGFEIDTLLTALLFSIVVSVTGSVLNKLVN